MKTHLETLLAHAGCRIDPETGGIIAPLHTATTYQRGEDGTFPHGNVYTRSENPTRQLFEETVCALEGGTSAMAFASGQAATMSVLQALPAAAHVVIPTDAYFGVGGLLADIFADRGLTFTRVDQTNLEAVLAAIEPQTRMIWAETPSNPTGKITDIRALAEMAHQHGAFLTVDNTWATPLLQQPFALGADFIVHSTTKYIGGHSDVLGGMVICKEDNPFSEKLRTVQKIGGAVADPFSCWMALRGLRSLAARMRLHGENALKVALFLDQHPNVEAVHYAGLPHFEGHELAKKQMKGFGGMVSFQVRGDEAAAIRVAAKVQVFTRATSLGGTESLIEHRYSIEKPPTATPPNLLRLSVGLEHHEDLIQDLNQALESL